MQTPINMSDTVQEEPHTPAPEDAPTTEAMPTQQEDGTPSAAIAPLEEEVIDGEVTAILEPEQKLPQKQPPYYLMVVGTVLACLLYLAASLLLSLLTPSATVIIIPAERSVTITAAIQVHGRQLTPLTLMQSTSVIATGKRHQDATRAGGTITFYNGLFAPQTIATGTLFTGNDGVQVIIDQPAIIPATNPPYIGQVTISAHTIYPGSQGNIPAGDINQPCCLTAVKAINTEAFTGGQNARDYTVVTRADIQNSASPLQATLLKSDQAALQAQLNPGEALIPPSCKPSTTADHRPGEEAKHVTVTVSETCSSVAYDAHNVYALATRMIHEEVTKRLGTGYSPMGDLQVSIMHTNITDQARGIATISVKLDATYVYQISPGEKQQIISLIAGKTKQQAQALVSQEPGIAGVVITINSNASTLPDNPSKITIVIAERL